MHLRIFAYALYYKISVHRNFWNQLKTVYLRNPCLKRPCVVITVILESFNKLQWWKLHYERTWCHEYQLSLKDIYLYQIQIESLAQIIHISIWIPVIICSPVLLCATNVQPATPKCNAPNNARWWRLVHCTTIPNGTEFSVSLPFYRHGWWWRRASTVIE